MNSCTIETYVPPEMNVFIIGTKFFRQIKHLLFLIKMFIVVIVVHICVLVTAIFGKYLVQNIGIVFD